MRTRTMLIAGALATVAAASLSPAQAGPPKPFTKTVMFTDATPDPTGNSAPTEQEHCKGELFPMEKPIEVMLPGPGSVEVVTKGFVGDWTLMITDKAGKVLGGADVNPPATEAARIVVKKAGLIKIHPCNLAGSTQAEVTYAYRYKKP